MPKTKAQIRAMAKANGVKFSENDPGTSYNPEYPRLLIEFFTIDSPYKLVATTKSYYPPPKGSPKGTVGALKVERCDIVPEAPKFLGQWERKIGITKRIRLYWEKKYPDFAAAVAQAKRMRAEFLISGALTGNLDSRFSQFAAANFKEIGWKQEVDHNVTVSPANILESWKRREKIIKGPNDGQLKQLSKPAARS